MSSLAEVFTIRVAPDDLDGGFVVSVDELPGCISQGETREEALANINDAMLAVLEVMAEDE